MKRIARFEKVSFDQFAQGWGDTLGITDNEEIKALYDAIRLPRRATAGSAGYDFFAPGRHHSQTGRDDQSTYGHPCVDGAGNGCSNAIREAGWALSTGCSLTTLWVSSTATIIIQTNEGHIFSKITNDSNEEKTVTIRAGEGFMQGIYRGIRDHSRR